MFQAIIISNNTYVAKNAGELSIDSIMVDLEIDGKRERQKNRNAFISSHDQNDATEISNCKDTHSDFIVRINPFSPRTESELRRLAHLKIDYVMLPMVKSLEQVSQTMSIMQNLGVQFGLLPLIEHIDGLNALASILDTHRHIKKVFFGLNDLSLSLNLPFLFQCLSDGYIDQGSRVCKKRGVDFGFGGIGLLGSNEVISPELILSEHARLGSSSTILSRSLRNKFAFLQSKDREPSPAEAKIFKHEVEKLKQYYRHCATLTDADLLLRRNEFNQTVRIASA